MPQGCGADGSAAADPTLNDGQDHRLRENIKYGFILQIQRH